VQVLRENRTATWREINLKYGTDTPVTRPYQTLWIDHGTAPDGQGYYYVQLPTASLQATTSFARNRPVRRLRADSSVHAVRLHDVLAANFWQAGCVAELTVDGPASLVMARGTVAISDPTQTRSTITVDLAEPGLRFVEADDRVRVMRRGAGWRLTADVTDSHGGTVTATFR
jgi:hyaluronate lyase